LSLRNIARRRKRPRAAPPRVGLFGLLGSGNLGNDASLEVVMTYLRTQHPEAVIDAMCMGPERLRTTYGIEAIPMLWYRRFDEKTSGMSAMALKSLGKGLDALRTASWVRRHDVVIVPGMGVLEATLPLRASGVPYAMFLLCASGRLFATKVALVSVGANTMNQRLTRWLFTGAARLAYYRSYRDSPSREAMRRQGVDTTHDRVCPDLVFGLPTPPDDPGEVRSVGVGVMAYYGANDDRPHADEVFDAYIEPMKRFIRWLVDTDHRVRLFWGDDVDGIAVQEIMADLRAHRPDLDPGTVVAEAFSSLSELMGEMALVGAFAGTRYHNVLCALKLSKPTLSIGYSAKHDALMADMGLSDFCQSARSIDVDRLIGQLTELENRSAELRRSLRERNDAMARGVDDQFAVLSSVLFPAGDLAPALSGARAGT
jgi:polysaccharide pyruvyl transferase WcaK-like protein